MVFDEQMDHPPQILVLMHHYPEELDLNEWCNPVFCTFVNLIFLYMCDFAFGRSQ